MYTFNEFQIDTSVAKIITSIVKNGEYVKEDIKQVFLSDKKIFSKDTEYLKQYKSYIKNITGASVAGTLTLAISGPLVGRPVEQTILLTSGIMGIMGSLILASYVNFNKKEEKAIQDATEEVFNTILSEMVERYLHPKTLTDEKIHEMTISLIDGEYQEKNDSLNQEYIYLFGLDDEHPCVLEPILDYNLELLYKYVMEVAYNASDGYEDLLKEIANFIKQYINYILKEKNTPEKSKEYEEKFNYYYDRCLSILGGRK